MRYSLLFESPFVFDAYFAELLNLLISAIVSVMPIRNLLEVQMYTAESKSFVVIFVVS